MKEGNIMKQDLIQALFKNGIYIERAEMTDEEVKAMKLNGIIMATDDITTGEYDEEKGDYKYYKYKSDNDLVVELNLKQYELLSIIKKYIFYIFVMAAVSFVGSVIGAIIYLLTLARVQA
jgi:hypothetical protein